MPNPMGLYSMPIVNFFWVLMSGIPNMLLFLGNYRRLTINSVWSMALGQVGRVGPRLDRLLPVSVSRFPPCPASFQIDTDLRGTVRTKHIQTRRPVATYEGLPFAPPTPQIAPRT